MGHIWTLSSHSLHPQGCCSMLRVHPGCCSPLWRSFLTWLSSSFLLCLQKVVEEEKQEHTDKVKELLGWALGLKQSVQGRTAAAGSRELGDIEKSISEQQVKQE